MSRQERLAAARCGGRGGWQQHGAEVHAHVPPWHATGNGEQLMPRALPERGNPIRAPALFLVQDACTWPQLGGAQPTAPPLYSPGSQPCCTQRQGCVSPLAVLFSSKASSHEIYWFFKCI